WKRSATASPPGRSARPTAPGARSAPPATTHRPTTRGSRRSPRPRRGRGEGSGGALLEPAGFVDDVHQRLVCEEATAVAEEDLGAGLAERGAVAGGVGRDEHAGHRPQRVVGGQGLLLEDVEAGARQLARAQRGDEIVEPRRLPAPDVDEERGA